MSRILISLLLLTSSTVLADGPRDNDPKTVRPVPRLGIKPAGAGFLQLPAKLKALRSRIQRAKASSDPALRALIPDVEIYYRAVHDALVYNEFFSVGDVKKAHELIATGMKRADDLVAGRAPWTRQTGLVVRGYVSKIDHTVQPYGLVIPESYDFDLSRRHRLDIWFHGRGETLSELNFIHQRSRSRGSYTPANTIVLHPYGRYSNAFKFAGEVDVLEALEDTRAGYRVDGRRISVRGFSMGGAACWQFAVHYSDRWFAANPGAGFSETPEFLKFFQKETLNPTWYEKRLWHWYDCTDWAVNLTHCPTVAYSGELDIQKQAADIMQQALKAEGIEMVHVIGPGTKHAIHPESKKEVDRRLRSIALAGRQQYPRQVVLATYTLKYNRMHWVTVEGLGEHWQAARVTAEVTSRSRVTLTTKNVTGLRLSFPPGFAPLDIRRPVTVVVDGIEIEAPRPLSDRSWTCRLTRHEGGWQVGGRVGGRGGRLRKRHNLQGPIDDAFMDSFVFVCPTGKPMHAKTAAWVESELERAIVHWRKQFRGYARVKDDTEVTDEDIASANLVLWGDPSSNKLLARLVGDLPVSWSDERVSVGDKSFASAGHMPVLIYPNPLNPKRYVVLNSGFTYREYAYLNNARQVPMLPDWAIVDLSTPPGTVWPGKIVDANFFDERWGVK
jgi:pimeloyl-ACP methyl ester carboxylesterase